MHRAACYFGGRVRACATPRFTHGTSWRFVRTPSGSTRSQPDISRPRITIGRVCGFWSSGSVSPRSTLSEHAALATGGDGHVAADEEGEAAEHLLLAHAVDAQVRQHLANPVGELLVVSRRREPAAGAAKSRASASSRSQHVRVGLGDRRPLAEHTAVRGERLAGAVGDQLGDALGAAA